MIEKELNGIWELLTDDQKAMALAYVEPEDIREPDKKPDISKSGTQTELAAAQEKIAELTEQLDFERSRNIKLSPEAWEQFQAALAEPAEPNEALIELLRRKPPWEPDKKLATESTVTQENHNESIGLSQEVTRQTSRQNAENTGDNHRAESDEIIDSCGNVFADLGLENPEGLAHVASIGIREIKALQSRLSTVEAERDTLREVAFRLHEWFSSDGTIYQTFDPFEFQDWQAIAMDAGLIDRENCELTEFGKQALQLSHVKQSEGGKSDE